MGCFLGEILTTKKDANEIYEIAIFGSEKRVSVVKFRFTHASILDELEHPKFRRYNLVLSPIHCSLNSDVYVACSFNIWRKTDQI